MKSYAAKRRRAPERDDSPIDDSSFGPPRFEDTQPATHELPPSVSARGWHSSSLELRDGLEVIEEVSIDTLPAELADQLKPRSS